MLKYIKFLAPIIKLVFRRPLLAVTLIPILPDGRLVMVRRRDDGLWSLPGGLVDWGESVTDAARRELSEETGLQLLSVERIVGMFSDPNRDPRFHSVVLSLAVNVEGSLGLKDSIELSSVKAFSFDSLPKPPFAHDHQHQLLYYQKHTSPILE